MPANEYLNLTEHPLKAIEKMPMMSVPVTPYWVAKGYPVNYVDTTYAEERIDAAYQKAYDAVSRLAGKISGMDYAFEMLEESKVWAGKAIDELVGRGLGHFLDRAYDTGDGQRHPTHACAMFMSETYMVLYMVLLECGFQHREELSDPVLDDVEAYIGVVEDTIEQLGGVYDEPQHEHTEIALVLGEYMERLEAYVQGKINTIVEEHPELQA